MNKSLTRNIEYLVCPENHKIANVKWNEAINREEPYVDEKGIPRHQMGIRCSDCDDVYSPLLMRMN